jgi:hypothetical protein
MARPARIRFIDKKGNNSVPDQAPDISQERGRGDQISLMRMRRLNLQYLENKDEVSKVGHKDT